MPNLYPRGPKLTPEQLAEVKKDPLASFLTSLDRVLAVTTLDPDTGCWLFLGNAGTRPRRIIFEAANGAIPPGAAIVHLWRSYRCIAPTHLTAITNTSGKRPHTGKPVRCINDYRVYPTIVEAAHAYHLRAPDIGKVCRGKLKTTGKRSFEYV